MYISICNIITIFITDLVIHKSLTELNDFILLQSFIVLRHPLDIKHFLENETKLNKQLIIRKKKKMKQVSNVEDYIGSESHQTATWTPSRNFSSGCLLAFGIIYLFLFYFIFIIMETLKVF